MSTRCEATLIKPTGLTVHLRNFILKKSHAITAGIALVVSVAVTYLSNRNSTVRRSIG